MDICCKNCKKFFLCSSSKFIPFPVHGCSEFISAKKHDVIVLHLSKLSKKFNILGFVDSFSDGCKLRDSHSCCGSKNHSFFICHNTDNSSVRDVVNEIKDECLLNICNNVAYLLNRAEIHMFRHRYSKSKFCFDKSKSLIADACIILDNY